MMLVAKITQSNIYREYYEGLLSLATILQQLFFLATSLLFSSLVFYY